MRLLLFWILTLSIAVICTLVLSSPNCNPGVLDKCGHSLFFAGYTNFSKPENENDVLSHCQDRKDGVKCIREYANHCLAAFPRQVVLLIIHGASRTIDTMCSEKGIKDALKHIPCLTDAIPRMRPCLINVLRQMQGVLEAYETAEERIPVGCCSLRSYSGCTSEAITSVCPEETNKYYHDLIEGYSSDMFDLACTGYEMSPEECAKSQVTTNKTLSELTFASFLPHALEIFANFS